MPAQFDADIMNDLIEVAYQSPTGLYTHEIKKELRNSKAERMGVWLSELDYSLWEFFGRPVEDYDDWPPEERAKYWPGYIRVTDPEDNEEVLYLVNCHLIIEIFDRHNCTPDVENPESWQKIRGVG